MYESPYGFEVDRYAAFTETPPEVVADILAAAHNAYDTIVSIQGGQLEYADIRRSQYCMTASSHLAIGLNGLGKNYRAEPQGRYLSPMGIGHFVSTVESPQLGKQTILADATWQQFLPQRNLEAQQRDRLRMPLPAVLIGTPQEIATFAADVGFDEARANAWSDAKYI